MEKKYCECSEEIDPISERCRSCARKKWHSDHPNVMIGNKYGLGFKHTKASKNKISKAGLKRYEDPEARAKISGINASNYIDGRSFNLKKWKKEVKERDNYTCQLCGGIGFIAHHIDYDVNNLDLDNGVCLCRRCHPKTNNNREYWIEFFQRRVVKKYQLELF